MGRRHFNGLKTALLLGGLSAFLLLVGQLIGGRSGLMIALLIALGLNAYSYWNSDKLALRAMRARPVSEAEQPVMYRIVRDLSTAGAAADAAAVRVADDGPQRVRDRSQPPQRRGLRHRGHPQMLDERELRGVLGHELMHVYNRDILTASVAAADRERDHLHRPVRPVLRGRRRRRGPAEPVAAIALIVLGHSPPG